MWVGHSEFGRIEDHGGVWRSWRSLKELKSLEQFGGVWKSLKVLATFGPKLGHEIRMSFVVELCRQFDSPIILANTQILITQVQMVDDFA